MHIFEFDAFSDVFAQKGNFVSGIEARSKIVFTILALAINLLSNGIFTPVFLTIFCLIILLSIRVPAKLILLRLIIPLAMAVVVLITRLFFYGETPLFTVSLLGVSLVGYVEGLASGLLIMCRVLAGLSLILLLSMSTPADKLFRAAAWFKVPRTFIEIALLVYRYIFVLTEELATMRDAQRVRLGYCSWRQSMRSLSTLGGSLLLQAYARAERVFEAMSVRGYANHQLSYGQAFSIKDGAVAFCLALVLVGFYLVGWTLA